MDIDYKQFDQGKPVQCIVIKDFSSNYIRYDVISSSLVVELRSFLENVPLTCFFLNYDLIVEKTGKKLNDEDNLFALDLEEFDIINMLPCLFNKRTVKEHFTKIKYILSEQAVCYRQNTPNSITSGQNYISKDYEGLISTSKKYYEDNGKNIVAGLNNIGYLLDEGFVMEKDNNNSITSNNTKETKEITNKDTTKDTKEISNKETNKKPNTPTTKLPDPTLSLEELKQKIQDIDHKKFSLLNLPNSLIYESSNKPQKFRCVINLYPSTYNTKRDMELCPSGDLYYIEVITLENKHFVITASEKGFFINNSTNTSFDPTPANQYSSSYSLPGLLSQVSSLFKENFIKTISQSIVSDYLFSVATQYDKSDWLVSVENPFYYNYRFKSYLNKNDNIFHCKEWNEEFQGILDIKVSEFNPIDNKEKMLIPFYNQFKQTSMDGAKLIIEKKIKSFNLSETGSSGYYIHENIFLTVLEDSPDYKIFNKSTQSQTITGSYLDMAHIAYLNRKKSGDILINSSTTEGSLSENDFYFGLCCVITYRGFVIHSQVMTPGIIFNSEHLIKYGEFDDSKVRNNEDFSKELKPFMERICIGSNDIKTPEGEEIKDYIGHPEIKGVNGVDKRKYLFDLVHIMPRDLNFKSGALLKPELIQEYKQTLLEEALKQPEIKEKSSILNIKLEKINKEKNANPNIQNITAKENEAKMKEIEPILEEKEKLVIQCENEITKKLRLNTVYSTDYETTSISEDEKNTLNKLASFLKNDMINKMLLEQTKDEELPCDSESLKACLQRFGIGVKYFGIIIERIEKDYPVALCWLKSLIIRDIIIKSARSVFNDLLKKVPEYVLFNFTAYFMNTIFSSSSMIKAMEYFSLNVSSNGEIKFSKPETSTNSTNNTNNETSESSTNTNNTSNKNSKKKKRNKKNKTKNSNNIDFEMKYLITENLTGSFTSNLINDSQTLQYFLKPREIWERIFNIAKSKYSYSFKSHEGNFELVEYNYNKFGMLRDFCKKTGISLETLDYELFTDCNFIKNEILKNNQLPFQASNIINFNLLVKDYTLPSEVIKPLYTTAETLFIQGNLAISAEKFKQLILLCNEVYGPISKYSAYAHKRLSIIYQYDYNLEMAIKLKTKAIVIMEKLCEFDSGFVASCYMELSTLYSNNHEILLAFKNLLKCLEITTFIYPKNVSFILFYNFIPIPSYSYSILK